ncbi:MAG: hypothetical protein GY811_14100, partial [Myxococcales bacterium]|nr:hypothetical protein [Myxococcales bacterium]
TRRVKTWKSGTMVLRWVGSAVMDAETKFRRLQGYKNMSKLVLYLEARRNLLRNEEITERHELKFLA